MIIPAPVHPLLPDEKGFFGRYGGSFVPEILHDIIAELATSFEQLVRKPDFWQQYVKELHEFSGRPTPITYAANLSKYLGGAQIYLKREDLSQTGAHKINNVIGQGLLVKRLGKSRVIAETGAGQHGVATATMAARYGFEATIYMGAEDADRQRPNVFWMEKMGAQVIAVESGSRTLKDAINQAMRDWSSSFRSTHYLLGTACGPHPFPAMVAYFQSIIGLEARQQLIERCGRLPNAVFGCVGGGSNALGIFQGFLDNASTRIIGVEAGGHGIQSGQHAVRFNVKEAQLGIAQGYKTLFLQNEDGQMIDTHSVAAGLDYVGVSPILADLHEKKRIEMTSATDEQAIEAVQLLMRHEGIIPALESSHGLAGAIAEAGRAGKDQIFLVNVSGRGDKDIFTIAEAFGDRSWADYLEERARRLKARRKTV
jgi:tryptophan synthase beta chain